MTQIPSSVLGASNRESSQKLMRFIEDWKSRRHKSRLRKKSKKRKSGYDSDDSFLDGENSSPTAVFVITGRTGTGKSRLVHAVSAGLDCALLEISTGEVRGGGALKKRLMESTLSHSSVALMKRREQVTVMAAESKKEFFDEESGSEEEEEERSSLTVILIDEVDLLFQDHGDTGFWLALSQLSQKAKSPIILTATSMPHELLSGTMKFEHIELHRPSIEECCAKMKEVAEAEGMVLKQDASGNNGLSLIAEYFQCDIRKILNEMQLFHFSMTNRSASADVVVFTRDWKSKSEDCSVDSDAEEEPDRPVILKIDPVLIPRDCYTLISIQGKNFQRTESATLYFGGEICRHFSVVSDSKILAVCPPLVVPDGISSGLKYQKSPYGHVINCLSTKFVKVVVRKRCSNGLFLDSTSCLPPHRSNWNIEYDVSLECSLLEQKLSRKEFIRKAKAQRKRLENAAEDGFFSSEEEFELEGDTSNPGHPIIDAIVEDLSSDIELRKNYDDKESEVSSSSPMRNVDPQVLLNEALSELMIEQSNEESTDNTTYANCSSTFHELHTFAEEMGRLSDVAFLEDRLLGVPMLAGAVEGIGSQSIDDIFVESMPTDPSVDKLCKEKKKPPSFESLYMSGLTEDGFFFGDADAYMRYPCRQRERSLLSNTELYSRGIGALDCVIEQEPPGKETSETTNDEFEQSDLECISSRIQSEDDMFICSQPPATLLLVPALLGNLMQDTAAFYRSNIANEPWLHQRRHAMSSKMFGIMSTILMPENSAIEHDWNKICFGFRHNERFTTEMAQKSRLCMCNWSFDHILALDYLPYLRFIARNENRVRLVSEDMMNGIDESTRNSRTSKRRKQHLRAHYLEEFCGKYGNQERLRQDVRDLGDSYLSGH